MRKIVIFLQLLIWYLSRYWGWLANILAAAILGLGVLAPFLMATGRVDQAQDIYQFLATQNHQLPQRSYFLFSEKGGVQSYSQEQIIAWGADPKNLQSYLGNPEVGFKMALNHRMTAIFIAILGGGLIWTVRRNRMQLSVGIFFLLTLPILIDGFSHMLSERSGEGFRETNAWAELISGNLFTPTFYTGATIGSLNWWLRVITGTLFGLGLVGYLYGYLGGRFNAIRAQIEPRLKRLDVIR